MRNWNNSSGFRVPFKGSTHLPYLWGIEISHNQLFCTDYIRAFTVPMRNWNRFFQRLPFFSSLSIYRTYEELKFCYILRRIVYSIAHLPYLWGIEISEYRQFKFINCTAFTVPMRNWNSSMADWMLWKQAAFTVPMRNWNKYLGSVSNRNMFCIYRTYEELKSESKGMTLPDLVRHLPYLWGIEICA